MINSASQPSHLEAELGANEARTEPYNKYGEGALELATTLCAKSSSGVGGSAVEQAAAVRRLR